jgi:hypothetical protein
MSKTELAELVDYWKVIFERQDEGTAYKNICGKTLSALYLLQEKTTRTGKYRRIPSPPSGQREDGREAVAEKDEAYRQRNYLVAAIAKLFPSGIRKTDIPGWSDDWHGCCFIDLPSGQISYHFHDSHEHLFVGLPVYTTPWDGHDKETVHARLLAITPPTTRAEAAKLPQEGKL